MRRRRRRARGASAASNICTNTSPTSRRDPLVEDGDQERPHCPGSTERSVTRVALLEPGVVVALDDRDELDGRSAELVAEEAVDLERVVLVGGVARCTGR